jgi:hypothetical protein
MKHDRTEAMLRMLFRSNECDSVHYETWFLGSEKWTDPMLNHTAGGVSIGKAIHKNRGWMKYGTTDGSCSWWYNKVVPMFVDV